MERAPTGSSVLDTALSGGIPPGAAVLVTGEEGAGATEFALSVLRASVKSGHGRTARFSSAMRSPRRVATEATELFEDDAAADALDLRHLDGKSLRAGADHVLAGLRPGDVIVLESADTLALDEDDLRREWRALADASAERGVTIMLLHAPGTLPPATEASLAETADGVLRFTWHDAGPTRRRVLCVVKMRGLSAALDGDQVPVFEVALHRGLGFALSRGKSVL